MTALRILITFSISISVLHCATGPRRAVDSDRRPSRVDDPVIAIFGDVHEEPGIEDQILAQMRAAGVTHIIGQGDFVLWGGIPALREALAKITPGTGVPKDRIFLVPGNWEQTLSDPAEVVAVMAEYGRVVAATYDGVGDVTIGDTNLRIGHFPQHPVAPTLTPPPKYLTRSSDQVAVVDTLARNDWPRPGTDVEVFSHTHIGGIYFDAERKLWVLNPGDLESTRKARGEPRAYVLYRPLSKRVVFVEADTGRPLREVSLGDARGECVKAQCPLNRTTR